MSARVCYIQREDRGAVLRGLRVLGPRTDESWEAPSGEVAAAGRTASTAAGWIAEQLNGRLGGRVLDRLCLDPDGGVCSWVTTASAEARMVRAVVEQEQSAEGDDSFAEVGAAASGRFPDLPGEVGYQPLRAGRPAETGPSRTPVLAMPDIAARSLIDALDEQGVQVGSCISIWQAMIAAFAPAPSATNDRLVAHDDSVFGVVLCTPGDRVIWAWGRGEETIAAGSFRTRIGMRHVPALLLEDGQGGALAEPERGSPEALGGRLAAEWLAWSAQIGQVPSRVAWVGPLSGEAGLDAGQVATALRRAAPNATVDAIDDPDPVGVTLRRLAENIGENAPGARPGTDGRLATLSNRPGRVHRAMYHWLAMLLLAASVVIGVFAWTFWGQRAESIEMLTAVRANQRALLERAAPELVNDRLAVVNLRNKVQQAAGPAPVDIPPPKPIISELETLAFVLGNPDYEVQEIDLGSISVTFRVLVDGTVAYEQLEQSLFGIAGSNVLWSTPLTTRPQGQKISVTGNGVWAAPRGAGAGATRPGGST